MQLHSIKRSSFRASPFIFLAFFVAGLLSAPSELFAATLDFSPSSGSYSVGQTFPLRIRVSSTAEAMNAVSGTLSFPEDLLEVASLSKSESIITLWVQEPSFSNSGGSVNFEGIVLNPGFSGSAGRVLTVQFRVKRPGQANILLSSASVLANDGRGTNILDSTGRAQFTLGSAAVPETVSAPGASDTGPVVTSSTHPDQSKWYQVNDAELAWSLPEEVVGIRLLLDKFPRSAPTITYEERFSSRRIENIENGLWYFHIRFREGSIWGPMTHYRLQIDNEKPRFFEIAESPRQDPTEPRVTFNVSSADDVSGIDRYEFKLDSNEGAVEVWKDDGTGRYTMKPLPPGKHLLLAKVFDRAGNYLANSVEFNIEGLEAPVITDYPPQVQEREVFTVEGESKYPRATVKLLFAEGNQVTVVDGGRTDGEGHFAVAIDDSMKRGSYRVSAVIVDGRGAESYPSHAVKISVAQNVFFQIGSFTVTLLTLLIPLLGLLFFLIFLIWYAWHKFLLFRRRLQKEVREAEQSLHKTFDMLREDIREQVKMLEHVKTKRQLTHEEERIIKQLKRHLDDSEEYVKKEIEDIENIRLR